MWTRGSEPYIPRVAPVALGFTAGFIVQNAWRPQPTACSCHPWLLRLHISPTRHGGGAVVIVHAPSVISHACWCLQVADALSVSKSNSHWPSSLWILRRLPLHCRYILHANSATRFRQVGCMVDGIVRRWEHFQPNRIPCIVQSKSQTAHLLAHVT
jgi:hypothetical protein